MNFLAPIGSPYFSVIKFFSQSSQLTYQEFLLDFYLNNLILKEYDSFFLNNFTFRISELIYILNTQAEYSPHVLGPLNSSSVCG